MCRCVWVCKITKATTTTTKTLTSPQGIDNNYTAAATERERENGREREGAKTEGLHFKSISVEIFGATWGCKQHLLLVLSLSLKKRLLITQHLKLLQRHSLSSSSINLQPAFKMNFSLWSFVFFFHPLATVL